MTLLSTTDIAASGGDTTEQHIAGCGHRFREAGVGRVIRQAARSACVPARGSILNGCPGLRSSPEHQSATHSWVHTLRFCVCNIIFIHSFIWCSQVIKRLDPHLFSLFDDFGVEEHYELLPPLLNKENFNLSIAQASCRSERKGKASLILSMPRANFVKGNLFELNDSSRLCESSLRLLRLGVSSVSCV